MTRAEINEIYTSFLKTTREFYELMGSVQSMVILVFWDKENPDLEPLAMPLGIRPGDEPMFEEMFQSVIKHHPPERYSFEFALFLKGTEDSDPTDTNQSITIGVRDVGNNIVHTTWSRSELGQWLEEDKKEGKYHFQWVPANEKTRRLLSKQQKMSYDFLNSVIVDLMMATTTKKLEK